MVRNQQPWQLLLLMGSGVFIASFWIIFGFLSVVGSNATWWQFLLGLAPGSAMLFLVLMARRAPLPYGSAMILLGGLMILTSVVKQVPVMSALIIGFPLVVLGIFFIFTRKMIFSSRS